MVILNRTVVEVDHFQCDMSTVVNWLYIKQEDSLVKYESSSTLH